MPHSTRHNMNARSLIKHELSATQQHSWIEERAAERTRDRMLTKNETEHGARVSEQLTRNQNSRHECRDPNTTLQHETRHADERAHGSSTLEAARSHENRA